MLPAMAGSSEIFVFNTTLVRLTPWMRQGRIDLTLERLASQVPDWSGGTKIGECLADFADLNRGNGHRRREGEEGGENGGNSGEPHLE